MKKMHYVCSIQLTFHVIRTERMEHSLDPSVTTTEIAGKGTDSQTDDRAACCAARNKVIFL